MLLRELLDSAAVYRNQLWPLLVIWLILPALHHHNFTVVSNLGTVIPVTEEHTVLQICATNSSIYTHRAAGRLPELADTR